MRIELLIVIYALRDRIEAQDWVTASLMVEHLLNLASPTVAVNHKGEVYVAEIRH